MDDPELIRRLGKARGQARRLEKLHELPWLSRHKGKLIMAGILAVSVILIWPEAFFGPSDPSRPQRQWFRYPDPPPGFVEPQRMADEPGAVVQPKLAPWPPIAASQSVVPLQTMTPLARRQPYTSAASKPAPLLSEPAPATDQRPSLLYSFYDAMMTPIRWAGFGLGALIVGVSLVWIFYKRRWWFAASVLLFTAHRLKNLTVRSDKFRRSLLHPWGNIQLVDAAHGLVQQLYYLDEVNSIPKYPWFFTTTARLKEVCDEVRPIIKWTAMSRQLQDFYTNIDTKIINTLGSLFPDGNHSAITEALATKLNPKIMEDLFNLLKNAHGFAIKVIKIHHANMDDISRKRLDRVEYTRGDRLRIANDEHHSRAPVDIRDYFQKTPFKDFLNAQVPMMIDPMKRFEHAIIIGGPGSGKSQAIEALLLNDIDEDNPPSIVLLDMKNDVVRRIAKLDVFHPEHGRLRDRLIILNAADRPPLGIFAASSQQEMIASVRYFFNSIVESEVSGPQHGVLSALLQLMAVMDKPDLSKLAAALSNIRAFADNIDRIPDENTRTYLLERFETAGKQTRDALARRIDQILNDPEQKAIFGSSTTCVNFSEALNSGKIILVAPGHHGGGDIFGRYILGRVLAAGFSREQIPEAQRKTVHVYCDEADPYVNSETMELFNRMRSFRIGCTFAFLSSGKMGAYANDILAETAIKFAAGLSKSDANLLARNMGNTLTAFLMEHEAPASLPGMRPKKVRFAFYVRGQMRTARTIEIDVDQIGMRQQMPQEMFERLVERNYQWLHRDAARPPTTQPLLSRAAKRRAARNPDQGDANASNEP
jgi:hypothetical protein